MQKNETKTGKRILACFMVIVMALTAVPLGHFSGLELGVTASAADLTEGYYTYTVENGEATITEVDNAISGDIVIPDKLAGFSVTKISEDAFRWCKNLTGIFVSSSIKEIDTCAFADCLNLVKIDVDKENKNYISKDGVLFSKDESVLIQYPAGKKQKDYSIKDSVSVIGEYAFGNCEFIEKVSILGNVIRIEESAFYHCDNLNSINLPDSLKEIGVSAFYLCKSLKSILIPDSVTSIGDIAFAYCYELKSIKIPNFLQEICEGTFESCIGLESIIIPVSCTRIGENVFYECISLKDIYYCGTENQWKNVYIGLTDGIYPKDVSIHFNYNPHTHTYTAKVTKAATCTTAGVMTYTCTCGDSYTKAIPATGKHTNKTTVTASTASKDGKIVTACTVCGKVASTVVIPKVSSFKLSATSYTYNGKAQTPTVTVKDSKGKTLKSGTDYTVKYASGRKNAGKYAVTVTLKGNYSGSKTLYFNILPGKTAKLTATQTTSSIKATWKAVTGASGYKVVLYSAKNKALKTVYTTKTTTSFTKLSKGTTYKIKVTAYKTIDGKKVLSSVNTLLTTATLPGTPTLKATAGAKKAALKWNKQTGATGYVVYMATSKNGSYKKVATVKGNAKVSHTKTGLTKGKTYYFKVAAYETVGGKTVTGAYSAVKAVKVK